MSEMTIEEITAAFAAVYPDERVPPAPVELDDDTMDAMRLSHAIDESVVVVPAKAPTTTVLAAKMVDATFYGMDYHTRASLQKHVVAGIVADDVLAKAVAPEALDADPEVAAVQIASAIEAAASKALGAVFKTGTLDNFGRRDDLVAKALALVGA